MRLAISLAMLTLGGGLLAACGHSTNAAHGKATGAHTATGATTSRLLTKQRALAFTHSVNLAAADVPGFNASTVRESTTSSEQQAERQMLRCAGLRGAHDRLAQESSKNFELRRGILDLGVSSEVGVAPSSALAARELAAIRGAHVRECLSHYLGLLFNSHRFGGASIGAVSIQTGTPPARGTSGSFGWRATATFAVRRIRVPFYLDVLGFVAGPAQVTLLSSGLGRPFPAAIQQQLFSLLLSRAKAHRL
jgi:hypothetical protein